MKRWLSWVHISSTFFQVVDIELSGHESDKPLISCNTTVIIIMKLNLFNTVKNEERGRGQQSVIWLKCSWPCFITSMYLVQRFPGGHSLCLAFGSFFYPHPPPPPFIFPVELGTDLSVRQVPSWHGGSWRSLGRIKCNGWLSLFNLAM